MALCPCMFCRENYYRILLSIILLLTLGEFAINIFVYERSFGSASYIFKTMLMVFNRTNYALWYSNVKPFEKRVEIGPTNSLHIYLLRALQNKKVVQFSNNSVVTNTTNSSLEAIVNDSAIFHSTQITLTPPLPLHSMDSNSTLYDNSSSVLCPVSPPGLVGKLLVPLVKSTFFDLNKNHKELEPGGRWHPPNCTSRHRVAIIIPYRNRAEHLRFFLHYMHPFLQKQQLDYGIYIIEQAGEGKFNRAMLMNIGFVEALKLYDYQCFIFHDVDLLPEDDRNIYACSDQPRHMSVAIDKFRYKLPYVDIFGGVSALTKEQFEKVNGFSNQFFGWGGEDDDMANRVKFYGYKITRYATDIARYKMLSHTKDTPNPERFKILNAGKRRFKSDGLNSLRYRVDDVILDLLFTWVYVTIR